MVFTKALNWTLPPSCGRQVAQTPPKLMKLIVYQLRLQNIVNLLQEKANFCYDGPIHFSTIVKGPFGIADS